MIKRSLSKMNANQLREIAVKLGGKKLYGTSKDSLIIYIFNLEKTSGKRWQEVVED